MSFAYDSFMRSKDDGSYPSGFLAAYSLEATDKNKKKTVTGIKGQKQKSQKEQIQ